MAFPDLATYCVELSQFGNQLCVTFPGGHRVCAQAGYDLGDPSEIIRLLLGQINSALAPLTPFFDAVDVIKAIADCVQAIPDALGPPPDPTGILNCIPGLVSALDKLLQLIPPIPLFVLIAEILDVLIAALVAFRSQIERLIAKQIRILASATRAAQLGNLQLAIAVDCANGNLEAQIANMNAGLAPLSRLLGVVNLLLELAGLGCIPPFGPSLAGATDAVLAPIDALIELLQLARAAIPNPANLVPSGSKDEC